MRAPHSGGAKAGQLMGDSSLSPWIPWLHPNPAQGSDALHPQVLSILSLRCLILLAVLLPLIPVIPCWSSWFPAPQGGLAVPCEQLDRWILAELPHPAHAPRAAIWGCLAVCSSQQ